MPGDTNTIGSAEDVAVVIVAMYLDEVAQMTNEADSTIRRWLSTRGLQLTDHKTEAVL